MSSRYVWETRKKDNVCVLVRKSDGDEGFSTVPRKSTGEWICRRLMAWLRGIGLQFVDIIVKLDCEF